MLYYRIYLHDKTHSVKWGMETKRIKPRKVRASLFITKEAQDIMFDHGYASARGMGMFLSQLVVEHHARVSRKPTQAEIAQELRRLASLLEEVNQVAPMPDKPMPLANIIDSPPGLVGVTVISEEDGCKEDDR